MRRRRRGHPAKQAERRERERLRREGPADPLRRAAATMCREAADLDSAIDAELWASMVLGSWWPAPFELGDDADLELGGPLVDEIARIGGPAGLAALLALGEVSESELGLRALEHAGRLTAAGVEGPLWREELLSCEILATAVMRDDVYDDGATIFVEATHGGDRRHVVGVYIDHTLGGMAKDILVADSLAAVEELVRERPDEHGALRIERISSGEAAARLHAAIERTDMTLGAPVSDDYAGLRALALRRADDLPGPFPDVSLPEVDAEEREALIAGFLAAPEGAGFAPDSDEAFVATLAVDFAADYVDGRPLRWSPSVVELFMADWLPRKVLADRATFDAAPAALDAWVRYAGRCRKVPEWAIEETCEAVATWAPEMLAQLDGDGDGDDAAGLAKAFLSAARAAGVDVRNDAALGAFVAGWNARSVD